MVFDFPGEISLDRRRFLGNDPQAESVHNEGPLAHQQRDHWVFTEQVFCLRAQFLRDGADGVPGRPAYGFDMIFNRDGSGNPHEQYADYQE